MARILVAEDEKNIRESVITALSAAHEVLGAASAEEALKLTVNNGDWDALITDIRMSGMSGIELTSRFRKAHPDSAIMVITAFQSVQTAVEAMKAGADEYLPKPFSLDELEIKLKSLLSVKNLKEQRKFYSMEKDEHFGEITGSSHAINTLKESILKAAPSDITVLLTGETGTGKELAAYSIHRVSGRKGPFVPVHCAAYARGIIESELFGHEKGSFTGAEKERKGRIEYAQDGTLFLDEIGDVPLDVQVKLLRVLENREFERVGGNKLIRTNARIICATNRDLKAMIKEGSFREDLYYRINVFPLNIPPLRERKEDIQEIADRFSMKFSGKKITDPQSIARLMAYEWPGNIRELQNIIERSCLLAGNGSIVITGIGEEKAAPDTAALGLEESLAQIERTMINDAMKRASFNQSKAAKELKINRTTLQYKLQKYGIGEQPS